MKLSVYIITFNEEQRLARTLKQAARVADEIIVVDSGSTDSTVEIAEKIRRENLFSQMEQLLRPKTLRRTALSKRFCFNAGCR